VNHYKCSACDSDLLSTEIIIETGTSLSEGMGVWHQGHKFAEPLNCKDCGHHLDTVKSFKKVGRIDGKRTS